MEQADFLDSTRFDPRFNSWLDSLDAVGPLPREVEPWSPERTLALLPQLHVPADLTGEIRRSGAALAADSSLRWLLDRCRHQLLARMGSDVAQVGPWPDLPAALGAAGRYFYLHVFTATCPDVRAYHAAISLPDEFSWATLAATGRHLLIDRDVNGRNGLTSQNWLQRNWRGVIFEIGRLQYEWYHQEAGHHRGPAFAGRATQSTLWKGNGIGTPSVDLHIPASGPLNPALCDQSLALAKQVLADLTPSRVTDVAACTSWLLDPQLAKYLPEDSNILRFQRRFTIVEGVTDGTDEMMRFVFRRLAPVDLDQLPQVSTLERAFVRHLLDGGRWHQRTGWFAFDE